MRKIGIKALTLSFAICLIVLLSCPELYGDESLQEEYHGLCIHSQEAESLSHKKLQELVADCDKLKKR